MDRLESAQSYATRSNDYPDRRRIEDDTQPVCVYCLDKLSNGDDGCCTPCREALKNLDGR